MLLQEGKLKALHHWGKGVSTQICWCFHGGMDIDKEVIDR
jgi:hypothetical protein